MQEPLRIFVVEDEVLLLMQLEIQLEKVGHVVVSTALSSHEAIRTAEGLVADLALVDVHLADGPTGIEVGRFIVERMRMPVVFMTANSKRLPEGLAGAIGIIAKPYTHEGLRAALDYIQEAIRNPPPSIMPPRSLMLAPPRA